MPDCIVWKYKLLSEGNFCTSGGSGNPSAVVLPSAEVQKLIICISTKWLPKVWFGLYIIWSKTKVTHFCEPWRSSNTVDSETLKGQVLPFIFIFWGLTFLYRQSWDVSFPNLGWGNSVSPRVWFCYSLGTPVSLVLLITFSIFLRLLQLLVEKLMRPLAFLDTYVP